MKEEDLQDLDQCVWIAVNHSLPTFQGDSRFSTWLVGICRYVFLTWLRRQRAEQTALPRQQEDPTAPDADSRRWETVPGPSIETPVVESVVIEEALKKLREKERLVIHFRYTEQLTDTEVAERMDLSLGTVKSHIRAALRRLREDNDLREAFVKGMTT